jgi:hypothetical protein
MVRDPSPWLPYGAPASKLSRLPLAARAGQPCMERPVLHTAGCNIRGLPKLIVSRGLTIQARATEGSWAVPPTGHEDDPRSYYRRDAFASFPRSSSDAISSACGNPSLCVIQGNLARRTGDCGILGSTNWWCHGCGPRRDASIGPYSPPTPSSVAM